MKIFVTGGAGFIGSNYVRWVLANTDHSVTVFDALTYAGNLSTLKDVDDNKRYSFVKGNICQPGDVEAAMRGHDAVVHFAAESHVDRSIEGSEDFILTNCFGTNVIMGAARRIVFRVWCILVPTRCTARSRLALQKRPMASSRARRIPHRRPAPT